MSSDTTSTDQRQETTKTQTISPYEHLKLKNDQLSKEQIVLLNKKNALKMRLNAFKAVYSNMAHKLYCLDETKQHIIEHEDFSFQLSLEPLLGKEFSDTCKSTSLTPQASEFFDESFCYAISPDGRQDHNFSLSSDESTSGSETSPLNQQDQESINQQDLAVSTTQLGDLPFNDNCKIEHIENWLMDKLTNTLNSVPWTLDDAVETVRQDDGQDSSFIEAKATMEKNLTMENGNWQKKENAELNGNHEHEKVNILLDNESLCHGGNPECHLNQHNIFSSVDSISNNEELFHNTLKEHSQNQQKLNIYNLEFHQNSCTKNTNYVENIKEWPQKENQKQMMQKVHFPLTRFQPQSYCPSRSLKRQYVPGNSGHTTASNVNLHTTHDINQNSDRRQRKMLKQQSCIISHYSGPKEEKYPLWNILATTENIGGEKSTTSNMTLQVSQITDSRSVDESQISAISAVKEGKTTASSIEKEDKTTASSIEKEDKITASSTEKEGKTTASSIEKQDKTTASSTEKEDKTTASSTEKEGKTKASSIEKEDNTTASSIEEEDKTTASGTEKEGKTTDSRIEKEGKTRASSTKKEGKTTASSTEKEGKTTASSIEKEGKTRASSTEKEGKTTTSSTEKEGSITDSSTLEDNKTTSLRTVEKGNITYCSMVEKGMTTASSTVEKGNIRARSSMEEDKTTVRQSKIETTLSNTTEARITSQSNVNALQNELSKLHLNEKPEDYTQQTNYDAVEYLQLLMKRLYLNNTSTTQKMNI